MGTADHDRAVELLKELGMKTYQAECFAALNTIPSGTAREISEVADVPRTRVYDATEALAEQGFIEVQHTNPQRFRAIPLSDAVRTLRQQYELRIERLHETLADLELEPGEQDVDTPEVWTVASEGSLDARIAETISGANEEAILVLGSADGWTAELETAIEGVVDRGVSVHIVTIPSVTLNLEGIDGVATAQSELPWLERSGDDGQIGRLVLVDRETLLLTTPPVDHSGGEHGIVAEGRSNGAVVLCRRLLRNELTESPLVE